MIIYFADRQMNILGQASTNLPEGILLVDDLKTEDVVIILGWQFLNAHCHMNQKK